MDACCQQAICVICLLNGMLLSNAKMISLWVVEIVPDFSDFLLIRKPQFLSCGADRNRNYLNHTGTKIFVSHRFTFCHFRINVVIVPIYIYLPNLEKSKGNLSKRKAFLLTLPHSSLAASWSLPSFSPLFSENMPVYAVSPSCPSVFTCLLWVGKLVTASPIP